MCMACSHAQYRCVMPEPVQRAMPVSHMHCVPTTCVSVLDSVAVLDNSSPMIRSRLVVCAVEKVRASSLDVPAVVSVP